MCSLVPLRRRGELLPLINLLVQLPCKSCVASPISPGATDHMSGADIFGSTHPFRSRARGCLDSFPFWPDAHIPGWAEERSASLYPLGRGIAPSYLCTRSCTGLNISESRHREKRNRECSNNSTRKRKQKMTAAT